MVFTMGQLLGQGTAVPMASTDEMQYHDIGGYTQEYDCNNLADPSLSADDRLLLTDEQFMAESVWQKTIEQGFKPSYVQVTITPINGDMNRRHIKVVEEHGLAEIPPAWIGHGTFVQPLVIWWAVAVIVAAVVALLIVVLVVYSPEIHKYFGLTPTQVAAYFLGSIPLIVPIAIVGALAIVGFGIYTGLKRR